MLRKKTIASINAFLKKAQEIPEEDETQTEEIADEVVDDAEGLPEGIEEKVDTLEDTVEVILDGLEEHKEIIEELLTGEPAGEEILEEFIDDLEEESEEQISDSEMGITEDARKEGAMSLRAQRRARLASRRKRAETISDQYGADKSRKKNYKQYDTSSGSAPKVKTDKVPEQLKIADLSLELTASEDAWVVLGKNDRPLCRIKSAGQSNFATESFAKTIIRDMQKMGIKNALRQHKAMKYVDEKKEKKEEKACDYKEADLQRKFMRALKLATNAMNKNLISAPLKEALYASLASLDVSEPGKIMEAAFAQGASAHFDAAFAQAEKYMGMSDEAFIELEAQIGETSVASVEDIPRSATKREPDLELMKRASEGTVPFSSQTTVDQDGTVKLQAAMPRPKFFTN